MRVCGHPWRAGRAEVGRWDERRKPANVPCYRTSSPNGDSDEAWASWPRFNRGWPSRCLPIYFADKSRAANRREHEMDEAGADIVQTELTPFRVVERTAVQRTEDERLFSRHLLYPLAIRRCGRCPGKRDLDFTAFKESAGADFPPQGVLSVWSDHLQDHARDARTAEEISPGYNRFVMHVSCLLLYPAQHAKNQTANTFVLCQYNKAVNSRTMHGEFLSDS